MNNIDIYATFYEIIKDSTEQGMSCGDKTYAYFINGAVAMAEKMLKRYNERPMPYNLAPFAKVEEYGKEDMIEGKIASHVSEMNCLADE